MMVQFIDMGQTSRGVGLKTEMEHNFSYVRFIISLVIQVKISGKHLYESESQGRN